MIETIIQNLNVDMSKILINGGILAFWLMLIMLIFGFAYHRPSGGGLITSSQYRWTMFIVLIASIIYSAIVPAMVFAGVN